MNRKKKHPILTYGLFDILDEAFAVEEEEGTAWRLDDGRPDGGRGDGVR